LTNGFYKLRFIPKEVYRAAKNSSFLVALLKKTREENVLLRAELEKKTNLEGNH